MTKYNPTPWRSAHGFLIDANNVSFATLAMPGATEDSIEAASGFILALANAHRTPSQPKIEFAKPAKVEKPKKPKKVIPPEKRLCTHILFGFATPAQIALLQKIESPTLVLTQETWEKEKQTLTTRVADRLEKMFAMLGARFEHHRVDIPEGVRVCMETFGSGTYGSMYCRLRHVGFVSSHQLPPAQTGFTPAPKPPVFESFDPAAGSPPVEVVPPAEVKAAVPPEAKVEVALPDYDEHVAHQGHVCFTEYTATQLRALRPQLPYSTWFRTAKPGDLQRYRGACRSICSVADEKVAFKILADQHRTTGRAILISRLADEFFALIGRPVDSAFFCYVLKRAGFKRFLVGLGNHEAQQWAEAHALRLAQDKQKRVSA